ncbi:hypothetical protein QBC47DRAFT_460164 [Echria macrotheca]|uniref:GED domain-containing protein n=1 Tax=Echria macrotheca TaxID=438768 RepID=A0AAJ0FAH0_9PEZI|nr:hypothetical protein QBC47DRAFT_460164 [Echria macrotheca]
MAAAERMASLTEIGKEDLKRFVVQSALLSLIDPVRGEPTRTLLDENPEGDTSSGPRLKQKFLDAFALICSTSRSGAETASAVCLEQHDPAGAILRVARNHGLATKDRTGLEDVLQILEETAGNKLPGSRAESQILSLVVELDRSRILSISAKIEKHGIRDFLRGADSTLLAGQVKLEPGTIPELRLWLDRCPLKAASWQTLNPETMAMLIDWASRARWIYQKQLKLLLDLAGTERPRWLDSLHKLARYRSAIKSMVKLAVKQPEVFAGVRIQGVPAHSSRPFSISKAKAPLLATIQNLVGEGSDETMEQLKKHLDTQDVEKMLRRACNLSLTLHAEMQLVVFYEGNPSLAPRMRFIGTSKKACFHCHEYLLEHPLGLRVSACHQKIYPSWMPPPYYAIHGKFQKNPPFMKQETTMTNTNIAIGDHRDLLDIIDSLRSQGVSHYVDLPEIIVCGDQSAGKSSVLEAISHMPFPTKDGLCTCFATELVLRRSPDVTTKVSITPGESRFGESKEKLQSWKPKASIETDGLGAVTEEAKHVMADPSAAATSPAAEFFDDILRIELTGPEQSHLTMVDLPGLFRTGGKGQSGAGVGIVRGMVERYMARPRSIILAVVSANYEYVLQDVTKMAKQADPEGLRTMGLITKPDKLDVGSESESSFVRLAQNMEVELRLGWHVLKNRSFEERSVTLAERDAIEREFFSKGLWSSIDPSHCGVEALRTRLSVVLRDQILAQLPSLVHDVQDCIHDCDARLKQLGPKRETRQEQLKYLLDISEDYTSLATQAVEGTYTTHLFFGNRKEIDKFRRRLTAVVRSRLGEFTDEMWLRGQSQYIVDSESEEHDIRGGIRDSPRISRSEYVQDVADHLKYSKGRELPGLFNPLIVSDLFVGQCEPWGKITRLLIEDVLEATHQVTREIVEHITARDVTEGVLGVVRQGVEGLKAELDAQVDKLLESVVQHTITYNPQLTENVQRIQQNRHKHNFRKLIRKTFGQQTFDDPERKIVLNPIQLLDLAGEGFEPDMERFGSALAVDYMEAYYKVALNRFIDDVGVLAIENCLISKLPTLFRASNFPEMSGEALAHLVGETPESSLERKRLEEKREILKTGLQSLHKRRNLINLPKVDSESGKESQNTSVTSVPSVPSVTSAGTQSLYGSIGSR